MLKLGFGAAAAAALGYGAIRGFSPGAGDAGVFSVDAARAPEEAFPLSVASGDPTPRGAVVWTRVDPARAAQPPLGLEVAEDEAFARVAHRAVVPAAELRADRDFTVKVDLDGALQPDRHYHYRFLHGGVASRVGRLRTLPAEGQRTERLRLGVVTCQNYGAGYYGAYARLAEEDLDYIVHLGDIIYEYASAGASPGRAVRLPSGSDRATDLADFRHLYRLYRGDRHFQRALERHTLIAVQDDHEVANNRHWDYEADRPRCPRHPLDSDAAALTAMYRSALQAWTEYVPARPQLGEGHLHEAFRDHRAFRAGDLAELFCTEERLYRHGPPCDNADSLLTPDCPERTDPARSMLGGAQRAWLQRGLADSPAVWKVWVGAVLLMQLRFTPELAVGAGSRFNLDAWDGFVAERERILGGVRDAGVTNLVALAGDWHASAAGHLLDRYGEEPRATGQRVGVEFMTPSISSGHFRDRLEAEGLGLEPAVSDAALRAANPHLAFFDGRAYGYSVLELTREAATFTILAVDKHEDRSDPATRVLRAFRVRAGTTDLEDVTAERAGARAAAVPPGAAPVRRLARS
jgi:alkaline phosphatase D